MVIISAEAHVNPAILKWAREHVGLSITDAAKGIVNQEKLANIEAGGNVHLTYTQFLKLATRYKVSVLVFYNHEIPDKYLPLNDLRTAGSRPVKEEASLRKEMMRVIEKRETMVEVTSSDDIQDYSWIGTINRDSTPVKETADFVTNLLDAKLDTRKNIRDEYEALRYWKDRIDQKGVLVFQVSNFTTDIARGFSIKEIPYPVIAVASKDGVLGRVFTLLHELTHLLLDEDSGVCQYLAPPSFSPVEQYCNAVAAEILVPQNNFLSFPLVRDHEDTNEWSEQTLKTLSRKYWASKEVIIRRLLDLNKATAECYSKEIAHLHSEGLIKRGNEEVKIPYVKKIIGQNPESFLERVIGAAEEQLITYSTLSRVLNMNLVHLQDLQDTLRAVEKRKEPEA